MTQRDALIDQLEAQTLSKTAFIEENYKCFVEGEKPPRTAVETVEEGIMAYHYYNTKAKQLIIEGNASCFRDPRHAKRCHDGAQEQYGKKDAVTTAIVALLDYKDMEAYFVNLHSEDLAQELYEIVLTTRHRVIFHSKDKRLLNRLRNHGVFSEEIQPSKIDTYVNSKYGE
ncbi:MAG: hypothetical protein JXO44_01375 [Clostridia bacterium]|nr:hypothetical protein [Clostridia bacterium]